MTTRRASYFWRKTKRSGGVQNIMTLLWRSLGHAFRHFTLDHTWLSIRGDVTTQERMAHASHCKACDEKMSDFFIELNAFIYMTPIPSESGKSDLFFPTHPSFTRRPHFLCKTGLKVGAFENDTDIIWRHFNSGRHVYMYAMSSKQILYHYWLVHLLIIKNPIKCLELAADEPGENWEWFNPSYFPV